MPEPFNSIAPSSILIKKQPGVRWGPGVHPAIGVLGGLIGEMHHHANMAAQVLIVIHRSLVHQSFTAVSLVAQRSLAAGRSLAQIDTEGCSESVQRGYMLAQNALQTWLLPTEAIRLLQRRSMALNSSWCTGEQWLSCAAMMTSIDQPLSRHFRGY
jgi:hypothetical protein